MERKTSISMHTSENKQVRENLYVYVWVNESVSEQAYGRASLRERERERESVQGRMHVWNESAWARMCESEFPREHMHAHMRISEDDSEV